MSSQIDPKLASIGQECLARKVRQASRQLTALYDERLRPLGLRSSQMNLLVAIGCHGEASPADLCRSLDLEKSTVSRNVARMVSQDWLGSNRGSDGGVSYRLTRKGRGLLTRAMPAWKKAESEAREFLGTAGVKALEALAKGLAIKA
jgi:DNA-binding MarR family transcriptional regulator